MEPHCFSSKAGERALLRRTVDWTQKGIREVEFGSLGPCAQKYSYSCKESTGELEQGTERIPVSFLG